MIILRNSRTLDSGRTGAALLIVRITGYRRFAFEKLAVFRSNLLRLGIEAQGRIGDLQGGRRPADLEGDAGGHCEEVALR